MHRLLRKGLIWTLAIALMMAGLPLAHADGCAQQSSVTAQDMHDLHDMHHDMSVDDAAMTDSVPSPQHDKSAASTPCKCLNCSSLCAAFVALCVRSFIAARRTDAARPCRSGSFQGNGSFGTRQTEGCEETRPIETEKIVRGQAHESSGSGARRGRA